MRTGTLLAVAVALSVIVALAGQRRSDNALPIPAAEPRSGAVGDLFDSDQPAPPGEGTALSGRVREVIDVAEYTYLRLETAEGEVWAAVSKSPVSVGNDVAVENPTRMDNFASTTLKRTFDVIYFGTLQSAAVGPAGQLPPGHPGIGDAASSPHEHGAPTPASETADLVDVKVPRAVGSNARTIFELFADGAKLEGKLLRVRGQIVKVTAGVMGKTYLRLRDGSGSQPGQRELVVTTQTEPRVGDVSTFEGTVRTQVDIGVGYHYPVMLTDARVVADAAAKAL
jgi:hypothetical protein